MPELLFGDSLPLFDGGVADLSTRATPCSSSKHVTILLRVKTSAGGRLQSGQSPGVEVTVVERQSSKC